MDDGEAAAFWTLVDRSGGPGACWVWRGQTGTKRHTPRFWHDGQLVSAKRVAWELTRGPLPAGWPLERTCGNRACVNPEHMRLERTLRQREA